jgi:hypothetical protein
MRLSEPDFWPLLREVRAPDDLVRAFEDLACAPDDLPREAGPLLFADDDFAREAGALLFELGDLPRDEPDDLLREELDGLLRDELEDLARLPPPELFELDDEDRPPDLRLSAIPRATIPPVPGPRATSWSRCGRT